MTFLRVLVTSDYFKCIVLLVFANVVLVEDVALECKGDLLKVGGVLFPQRSSGEIHTAIA